MSKSISSEDRCNQAIISQSSSSPTTTTITTRSYECTFCKRGFTNAQALGGHMNIHRKDKAKLKQLAFSPHLETKPPPQKQSSEIKIDDNSPYSSPNLNPPMTSSLEGSGKTTTKWTNNLFLINQETTLIDDHNDQKLDDHERSNVAGLELSDSEDLDLELRLGPEPPQDSSSTPAVATRKFF